MHEQVVLRLAVPADAQGIIQVARRTWNDTYTGIISSENQERLLDRWYAQPSVEADIAMRNSWFYVAEEHVEVIGYAQFVLRQDRRGELTRIYLLPEWQ